MQPVTSGRSDCPPKLGGRHIARCDSVAQCGRFLRNLPAALLTAFGRGTPANLGGELRLAVALLFLVIPAFAQKPAAEADPFTLTAKSANVAQPGLPVKVVVFRWSSEEERNRIVLPLDPAAQAAAQAAAAAEGRGRGGRGERGARGSAPALDPDDPALAEVIARGRSARGRGDAAAKPPDPIS